jgi:putative peptidoglycan lipid II flippase
VDEAGAGRRPGRRRSSRSATGLSRILGLVREIVARYYFGTVGAINAFEVAFLIPNTVRALVADAALVRVRAGVQRAAREGRAETRLARRVEPLLARPAGSAD